MGYAGVTLAGPAHLTPIPLPDTAEISGQTVDLRALSIRGVCLLIDHLIIYVANQWLIAIARHCSVYHGPTKYQYSQPLLRTFLRTIYGL